jgi:hypothetical protein
MSTIKTHAMNKINLEAFHYYLSYRHVPASSDRAVDRKHCRYSLEYD